MATSKKNTGFGKRNHLNEEDVRKLMLAEGLEMTSAQDEVGFVWDAPDGGKWYAKEIGDESDIDEDSPVLEDRLDAALAAADKPTAEDVAGLAAVNALADAHQAPAGINIELPAAPPSDKLAARIQYSKNFVQAKVALIKEHGYYSGWVAGQAIKEAAYSRKMQTELSAHAKTSQVLAAISAFGAVAHALDQLVDALHAVPKGLRPKARGSNDGGSTTIEVGSKVVLREKMRATYDGLLTDLKEELTVEALSSNNARLRVRSIHDGVLTLPGKDLVLIK